MTIGKKIALLSLLKKIDTAHEIVAKHYGVVDCIKHIPVRIDNEVFEIPSFGVINFFEPGDFAKIYNKISRTIPLYRNLFYITHEIASGNSIVDRELEDVNNDLKEIRKLNQVKN